MDKYLDYIDKQIKFNQGKNIFLDADNMSFGFTDETIKAISNFDNFANDDREILLDYATDKAIEEFCGINQYFSFNLKAKSDLRNIYSQLFSSIRLKEKPIVELEKKHYQNLRQWLHTSNPFAEKFYSNTETYITPVACSEYGFELQIDILRIDTLSLMQPVLDIGCGKHGNIVNHFLDLGIEVYGIDRLTASDTFRKNSDWLEYDYGQDIWGTIISNLGFTNHFAHHHLRKDGNYIGYAKKYMDILKSLKIGGKFHYAPDLPFIELYLDKQQYQLTKYNIGDFEFKTSIIERLK